MKNSIKILTALLIVFSFFSCSKDADPVLEIYVSAKQSDLFHSVSLNHGYIRIWDSHNGGGNIQQYNGAAIAMDLTKEVEPILIGDESHWAGNFVGLNADLGNIMLEGVEGNTIKATTRPTYVNEHFGGDFELEVNKRYRIDFIYDIDASIIVEDGAFIFDTVVEVIVEEI